MNTVWFRKQYSSVQDYALGLLLVGLVVTRGMLLSRRIPEVPGATPNPASILVTSVCAIPTTPVAKPITWPSPASVEWGKAPSASSVSAAAKGLGYNCNTGREWRLEREVQPTTGGEDLGNKALPRVGSRAEDLRIRSRLRGLRTSFRKKRSVFISLTRPELLNHAFVIKPLKLLHFICLRHGAETKIHYLLGGFIVIKQLKCFLAEVWDLCPG